LIVTQLVSGVWHGLYPGYFMFFVGSAFTFASSTVIYKWEQAMPGWLVGSWPWWAAKVMVTRLKLDFLAMAFLHLEWNPSVQIWRSVYYLPGVFMVSGRPAAG